jgi:hypothetical protein
MAIIPFGFLLEPFQLPMAQVVNFFFFFWVFFSFYDHRAPLTKRIIIPFLLLFPEMKEKRH